MRQQPRRINMPKRIVPMPIARASVPETAKRQRVLRVVRREILVRRGKARLKPPTLRVVKPARAASDSNTEPKEGHTMKREELTEKILDIKRQKGWTWKHICNEIGGMAPTLVVGALLGQMKLVKPLAKKAAALFGLSAAEEAMLNEVPYRGTGTPMPPTDPLIYRFYEMVMINGPAWKALIEEEFGDGIMSAIDFDFDFERVANPKGDRVKITMSGKFLPYKYYGNEQGIPEYGLKEV
jgi:cyanate lyase